MQSTALGYGVTGNVSIETAKAIARRAEELGLHSLWFNDTPGGDSLSQIEAAANETSRLVLGSGVISVDRKPAPQIVEEVRAKGIPLERAIIGIGSAAKPGALQRIEESLEVLRNELDVRTVVGSLGPKMRRLGARRSNGLLFNWLPPRFARQTTEEMRSEAAAAGNAQVIAATYIRTALGQVSYPRLEDEARRYSAIPAYAANFERLGISALESSVFGEDEESVRQGLAAFDGAVDHAIVRAITPSDGLDQHLQLLDAVAPLA